MSTTHPEPERQRHDFDDDSVCRKCGFDGAEWWHLERMKRKDDRAPEPACFGRSMIIFD
jgi:hypothetical protein